MSQYRKIFFDTLFYKIIVAFVFTLISIILSIIILTALVSYDIYSYNLEILNQKIQALTEMEANRKREQDDIYIWNAQVKEYQSFTKAYTDFIKLGKSDNFGNISDLNYCLNYKESRKRQDYKNRPKFDYLRCVKLDKTRFFNGYPPTQVEFFLQDPSADDIEARKYNIAFTYEVILTGIRSIENTTLQEQGIFLGRLEAMKDISQGTIKTDLKFKNPPLVETTKNNIPELKIKFYRRVLSEILNEISNVSRTLLRLKNACKMGIIAFVFGLLLGPSKTSLRSRKAFPTILIRALLILSSPYFVVIFLVNPMLALHSFIYFAMILLAIYTFYVCRKN